MELDHSGGIETMANKKLTPQPQEEPIEKSAKRLLKRERLLLEQLREAQQAQAEALERFQRAEARLLKRTGRIQRIGVRLMSVRQQLETIAAPSSTIVTELAGEVTPPPSSATPPTPVEAQEAPVEQAALNTAVDADEGSLVAEEAPQEAAVPVEVQAIEKPQEMLEDKVPVSAPEMQDSVGTAFIASAVETGMPAATPTQEAPTIEETPGPIDMAASATGGTASAETEVPEETPPPKVQATEEVQNDVGTAFI